MDIGYESRYAPEYLVLVSVSTPSYYLMVFSIHFENYVVSDISKMEHVLVNLPKFIATSGQCKETARVALKFELNVLRVNTRDE